MLPRPRIWGACRALAVRTRPPTAPTLAWSTTTPSIRRYADDATQKPPSQTTGWSKDGSAISSRSSTSQPAARASESAPEVETPETAAQGAEDEVDNGAELLRAAMRHDDLPDADGHALTPEQELALYHEGRIVSAREAAERRDAQLAETEDPALLYGPYGDGFKFPPPTTPMPPNLHLKKRYHPVLDQLTRLLMRDGKLSAAQKHMAHVLNFLRTSSAPLVSPRRPLLPGTPPPAHLPLNPVLYLTVAVDSVAPLLRVLRLKNAGGGGRSLEVPFPLSVRQRRRQAWRWIMDVVNAKPSVGSGRKQLAHRIGEEIVAIVEGRSSVWDRKMALQKMATTARVNVAELGAKRKKRMGR